MDGIGSGHRPGPGHPHADSLQPAPAHGSHCLIFFFDHGVFVSRSTPSRDKPAAEPSAPAALDQLDSLLQHRSRLGALVLLSGVDALSFSRLKGLLEETDGNLGAQLRKLEDAGYVSVEKAFADRKPVRWYSITATGRRALKTHLGAVESLIKGSTT
jgi:DNA-binding MarR family transcriptional regulator